MIAVLAWTILDNNTALEFDTTLGFPGEGPDAWSNNHPNLTITTWNTRSLTFERFNYCKNLGFDVLTITELWRSANKHENDTVSFLAGKPQIDKDTGNPSYPDDIASGGSFCDQVEVE